MPVKRQSPGTHRDGRKVGGQFAPNKIAEEPVSDSISINLDSPPFDLDDALRDGDRFEFGVSHQFDESRYQRSGNFYDDCQTLVNLSAAKKRMQTFADELAASLLAAMQRNGLDELELSDGRTVRVMEGTPQWDAEKLEQEQPELFEASHKPGVDTSKIRSARTPEGWYSYCAHIHDWEAPYGLSPQAAEARLAHFKSVAATVPSREEFLSDFPASLHSIREALWGAQVSPAVVVPDDFDERDYVTGYGDESLACTDFASDIEQSYDLYFEQPLEQAEMLAQSRDYIKKLNASRKTFMSEDPDNDLPAFLEEVKGRADDNGRMQTYAATMQVRAGSPHWNIGKLKAEHPEVYASVERRSVVTSNLKSAAGDADTYERLVSEFATKRPYLRIA